MTVTPIVALDVPTPKDALALVHTLGDSCRFYKVGSELFTAAGPSIISTLRAAGCQLFLDLKFHDIPTTVQKAATAAANLGASIITAHASGGEPMLRAAVQGAGPNCQVFAVTVLTSLDPPTLAKTWGKPDIDIPQEVLRLATLASNAQTAGVVCSGLEAQMLHAHFGPTLKLLIPGIRLPNSPSNDQSRTVTPAQAVAYGASYIILGRTVTHSQDPRQAMESALAEVGGTAGSAGRIVA